MGWPTVSDYQAALREPRKAFSDPFLKESVPASVVDGTPRAIVGRAAAVFRMTAGSSSYALRCILQKRADIVDRYVAIRDHLDRKPVSGLVDASIVEKGIRVGEEWYPVVRMEWVEGATLNHYVESTLARPEAILKAADRWVEIAGALERAGVSHGDLEHGNILVTDERMRLVDYDAMYVPGLHGRRGREAGHPAYQHPARAERHSGAAIDRFPAQVIYLSLLAIGRNPDLWSRFYHEDNLIFRPPDFADPNHSPVFAALEVMDDPVVSKLAEALKKSCRSGLSTMPRLSDVLGGKTLPRAAQPTRGRTRKTPPRRAPGTELVARPMPAHTPVGLPDWLDEEYERPIPDGAWEWRLEWSRPGTLYEKHVHKVPVFGTRKTPSNFLGLPIGSRQEKYIERYTDKIRERELVAGGHRSAVTALAASADGRAVVSGSRDRTVRVWSTASGREACPPLEAGARPVALAFVPRRPAVVVALDSRELLMWDYGVPREVLHLGMPDRSDLGALAVSEDGRWLAAGGSNRTIFIWGTERGDPVEEIREVEGRVMALLFIQDGAVVVCATDRGRLELFERGAGKARWNVNVGRNLASLIGSERKPGIFGVDENGHIWGWELMEGRATELPALPVGASSVKSFSPDGRRVLVGTGEGGVRVFDVENGKDLGAMEGPSGTLTVVCATERAKVVAAGGADGVVRLWLARPQQA